MATITSEPQTRAVKLVEEGLFYCLKCKIYNLNDKTINAIEDAE